MMMMMIDKNYDDDVAGEFQPILAEVGGRAVSDSSFLHRDNQPCYPRTIFDDRSHNSIFLCSPDVVY